MTRVRGNFIVHENAAPQPVEGGTWSMYLAGRWYGLTRDAETTLIADVVDALLAGPAIRCADVANHHGARSR